VQIRRNHAFLLLVVFAIFLGIAIFHPLSHGSHYDGDDGHDCPICLWVHNNTVFVSPIAALLISFTFLCFCRVFFFPLPVFSHFVTQSSHAPPF
jgi:hypothetical protein